MEERGWPGMHIQEDVKPSIKKGLKGRFAARAIEFKFQPNPKSSRYGAR